MRFKNALIVALIFVGQSLIAQNREVLFYIDNDPVYATDFKAIYNKNKDVGEQIDPKTPEEYLKLYINFKLKVKEAIQLGMDTAEGFQKEFLGYRNTLAKPYFSDSNIDERLIKEAYDRMQMEVRASHIMFELPKNASPSDTLKIYNEALKLRKELLNGKSFEETAKEISKDTYSAVNGGDLGYFTAFNMVYPFEDAAFKLNPGEISMPVRSQFGYHIIKTTDKRAARGQVEVAHIMVSLPEEAPEQDVELARKKINDIFEKLKSQESFEALARQYSDDKSSGRNGGRLQPFGINTMVKEFEEEAFKLNIPTAYSEPFRTKFGFHIVQLIRKIPVPNFEESERDLKSKIQRDARSNLSKQVVIDNLKKEYNFKTYPKNIQRVVKFIKPEYLKNEWSPENYQKKMKKPVLTFAGNTYSQSDLIAFMILNQHMDEKSETVEREVYKNFNNMAESYLFAYEDGKLEEKYDDFRLLVNEYRDGILLFEIMEEKVWGKSLKDTAGLMAHYEMIKNNHKWSERAEATIIKVSTDKNVALVEKMLKQGISADSIARTFNKNNTLEISLESGKYEKGDQAFVDANWGKKGIVRAGKEDGRNVLIVFNNYLPADFKKLNEIRGIVTTEYQNKLEKEWLEELQQKYTVRMNEEVKSKVIDNLK